MSSMENGVSSNGGECEWRGSEAGSLPETNPYDFVLLNLDDLTVFTEKHEEFEKALATRSWNVLLRLYSLKDESGYPEYLRWSKGFKLSIDPSDIPLVFERPFESFITHPTATETSHPADLRLGSLELLLDMVDEAAADKQTDQERAEAIQSIMGPGVGERTVGFLRAFVKAKKAEMDVSGKTQPDG